MDSTGNAVMAKSDLRGSFPDIRWACALFVLAVLALYWETLWSMVSIWNRSDTYAHGYMIAPLSLWLVWSKREALSRVAPRPAPVVLLLLLPGGLAWLLAELAGALVVQQLAVVGMIIVGIWALVGHGMAKLLAFPLGFLLLAVPMGEDLVPPMMEFTATSTVWLIQLTGIPVYREGLYFTLPSGNWSVVEACSGVRYLIASVTLGLLYAHLTYRSLGRQLLFVLAAVLVPVLANTGRAYLIVMLGHLSDMSIATGVDHLVYGWLFFGIVMLLLFWIGSFWREDEQPAPSAAVSAQSPAIPAGSPRGAAMLVACVVLAGMWPLFAAVIDRSATVPSAQAIEAAEPAPGWAVAEPAWNWQPRRRGSDRELIQFYRDEGRRVALYLEQYLLQREGAELVSGKAHQFVDEEGAWRIAGRGRGQLMLDDQSASSRGSLHLSDGNTRLQLWYWYRIGDRYTANPYMAKAWEALHAITFDRRDATLIIVATELGNTEDARARAGDTLQRFVAEHLPAIEAALDAGVVEPLP